MKIIFFGTGRFAVPTLYALAENFNVAIVVTKEPKPAGRGKKLTPSAIQNEAKKLKLKVINNLDKEKIKKVDADLFIVVDYGKIIPQEIIDMPSLGAINIHPSKLPKYRGPSPIQSAILAGDNSTAISIMLIDNEMDHGPILAQKFVDISKNDTSETLFKKLSLESAPLLIDTLKKYIAKKIKPKEQDHDKATFCKMIKKEYGKIDWNKSATEIYNMVRALYPWPGTYTYLSSPTFQGGNSSGSTKTLKILSVRHHKLKERGNPTIPGAFFKTKNGELAVMCGNGALILEKVQLEGKKPITGEEFIRGYFWHA